MARALFQMMISLALVTVLLHLGDARRLLDDLDNEISVSPNANTVFKESWVKISKPPEQNVKKEFGDHVELSCEAIGSPPPTIQWFKRNMRIVDNEIDNNLVSRSDVGLAKVSSRLVINYLLPRHEDVYSCIAKSKGEVATAVTKLTLINGGERRELNFTELIASKIIGAHHLPRITFWAPTYMDVIGSDVILPCKSVGNPKPTLMWLNPQGKVIDGEAGSRVQVLPDGELRIRSIIWEDMGMYVCFVENKMGENSEKTFLYPMQPSK